MRGVRCLFYVEILGVAICIQTSSLGRTAKSSLSGLHLVSIDLSLERGSLKRDCLLVSEKKRRYLIALDEAVVKANKTKKCVRRRPEFIVDKAPWLIDALKSLDLEFERSVLSEHEIHPKYFMRD